MYEMWGAMGIEPWPHTWAEYRRMFTGWRRHWWEHTGHLCVTIANGLLPRKDRRSWRLIDFCSLFKPPARWKARGNAFAEALIGAFCQPPPEADPAPVCPQAEEPPDTKSGD